MSTSADRHRAARFLIRIENGAYSSRILARRTSPGVRTRVLGVLRWQRLLDEVLTPHCARPITKLDPEVRAALRIGLFESGKLEVPPAVATDGSVRLIRRLGKGSAAGLVNAVLRRSAGDWHRVCERSAPDVLFSHPEWLYRRWCEHFGDRAAHEIITANQRPAPLCAWFVDDSVRYGPGASPLELTPHPWCPGAWTTLKNAADLVDLIERGSAYAQDASSQLIAHLAVRLAGRSARVVDLCAAPGGKTALMLKLGDWQRAVACDLRFKRARLVKTATGRVGGCPVVVADAVFPPLMPGAWDLVLLDAPCSGTGTLRRRPELRWRLTPGAIKEMSTLQHRLLGAATDLVAPGGFLLYATCSIEPEENEDVISSFMTNFEIVDLGRHLPAGTPSIETEIGGRRILPCEHGDGFSVHALRRKSERGV